MQANLAAFKAGYNFGETAELFVTAYQIKPDRVRAGRLHEHHRQHRAGVGPDRRQPSWPKMPLFLGSYPITPASDILHELSKHKNFGVRTMQAEDEIAGIGAALGAAFGGHLGVTTTSGPGVDLKSETMGLAVSLELPLIIIDIQRGGPSTGLPTKTEQADLMLAMYGRHGECPMPIVAAKTPSHCFHAAIEAARIALKYRTPVILLSDGYLANGAEPWKLPDVDDLPDIKIDVRHRANHSAEAPFLPYLRDPDTLARPWADPRHARPRAPHRRAREGRRHRQRLVRPGQPRAHGADPRRPRWPASPSTSPASRSTATRTPTLLVLGWGSTYGAIAAAVRRIRASGHKAATPTSCTWPVPAQPRRRAAPLPEVLVPEMNLGQLGRLVRAEFLVDAQVAQQDAGPAVHGGRRSSGPCWSCWTTMTELRVHDRRRRSRRPRRRTGSATRRCAGAPVAATTRSSPPSRC